MKRLFKYIAHKFWGPFFFAVGIFSALVVLGDTFEKLKTLGNGISTLSAILTYSLFSFPNWLTTIMPVACLLAAISVVSEMVANGEWTACVAGGFAPRQLFKPIIWCIILVSIITLAIQEFIVPPLNVKAKQIYYTRIKHNEGFQLNAESDVTIKLSDKEMLYARWVDLDQGLMQDVSIDSYDNNWNIASQLVARRMVWDSDKKAWVLEDGTKRIFTDKTTTYDEAFASELAPVYLPPKDMSVSKTEGKLLSVRDLTKRIAFFKRTGLSYYVAETNRQSKLAVPFVTLIMCLLGIPFAISTRRKSKILNIIACMVIAFTFWWLISVITSMGENGFLNPYLAGWGPVLVFGVIVFLEFRWMKL